MELSSTEIKNTVVKKAEGGDQELGLECIKLDLSISSPMDRSTRQLDVNLELRGVVWPGDTCLGVGGGWVALKVLKLDELMK